MNRGRNIVLTGFMATGKSAVGRIIAERIGYGFFDVDGLIEDEAGVSVSKIFEIEGEASFRDRETKKIEEVSLLKKAVISTGGGALIRPENREMLSRAGLVVCLSATEEEILRRAGKRESRPLINVENPHETIRKLLRERKSYYDTADVHIDTTGRSKGDIAGEIISAWKDRKSSWNK